MEKVIKIENLKKNFGNINAIDNISFNVAKGEMFGFIGPDGAGKTTTIRILCGILKEFEGEVEIIGYNLKKSAEQIKRKIGYLSQEFSLYKDLTVDENIEFFAELHQIKDYEKRRKELLEFTKMGEFRNRKAKNLSGGMKKKLALACTLIHRPEIIFLDEPTNGVDPVSRREFWEILAELLKSNVTIFLSTPYIDEAERCSRVGMLNKGRLLGLDTPQNLKDGINQIIYEIILSEVRKAYRKIKSIEQINDIQSFGDRVHLFLDDDKKNTREKVMKKLKEENIHFKSFEKITPSLEDAFIYYLQNDKEE
ncbi:MAG: ABC transporter ATP-binding protein [Candidatus Mcinerneyibacterium aminivorans]|uniref:ABC transporter ATP-binding protein n=1 Tax=Candidatus Mcinerneyibacterium aminivorans TaxID=2703815 RepID=A0A5D0MGL0_9BACT|nr:MAG: ABC transporter ATP-binding protein [Candidatus Mcinerneyibacterium aminivorans]